MGLKDKYDVDSQYFIFAVRIHEITSCRTSPLLLRYIPYLYFIQPFDILLVLVAIDPYLDWTEMNG